MAGPHGSRCVVCRKLVDPYDPDTWSQVINWIGGPKRDHARGREYTGRFMHGNCMRGTMEGATPDQATLDDSDVDPRPVREHIVPPEDLPFGV